jgi:uncharacterized SAM-binding protein YcdF (DUF218 family)
MPRILVLTLVAVAGLAGMLFGAGFLLDGPRAPLQPADAIIVISGDEDLARFREGLRLWRAGWAPRLVFSGAARAGDPSNARVMRDLAIRSGVPPEAILIDEVATDTYENAAQTRRLLEAQCLWSAILVTSPYHLRRASLTFDAVYAGSGIRVLPWSAPDSAWRKLSWWLQPETRRLTVIELSKLAYIVLTGRHH